MNRVQDKRISLDEAEYVTFECPLCEDGDVRVDAPMGLYTGRPVTLSTSKGSTVISAGVAVGRCNSCKLPIPIEPINVNIRGELTERNYRIVREKIVPPHR